MMLFCQNAKCGEPLPEGAKFCPACGRPTVRTRAPKKRGNGQGSVYRLENGKYKAAVTLGYYLDEDGKRHRRARTQTFDKKKDAVAALATLGTEPAREARRSVTFKGLYDLWIENHGVGESAIRVYKSAFKHFRDIWYLKLSDIELDDLQECIDSCPAGKRTKISMKTACGLMYKFGIPRHMVPENLNLAQFLKVSGSSFGHREGFTDGQIKMIRDSVGAVPYADYIYCMIYTGFRPSEFLSLTVADYDLENGVFVGGSKTEAGRGRTVTVSPKIKGIVDRYATAGNRHIFCGPSGEAMTHKKFAETCFYPALEQIGIENPVIEGSGVKSRHKYTPHSCRHTFSTLMKGIPAADKDKLELIGHANGEMLRYYQDVNLDDLRRITDAL